MKIVITGANGFIGKNLQIFLKELKYNNVELITSNDTDKAIESKLKGSEFIYHLAGINRPKSDEEFLIGNCDFTQKIIDKLKLLNITPSIVLTSSIQSELDNPYGKSKAAAENVLLKYNKETSAPVYIYKLPNVFGKWCKPNYNSAVATFCFNTINELPITVHNAEAKLNLVYIDDVCKEFVSLLSSESESGFVNISTVYESSVGEVVDLLQKFKKSRDTLVTEKVGNSFVRALYSTYVSYFNPDQFSYSVKQHSDERGSFVEMLKTKDSGQFSFFTAHPGITRGGHYHHTKTEKFLVIKGSALFKFRNIVTDEVYELVVDDKESQIVETAPGWSHDITNTGKDELIVMLWANEVFDQDQPDTVYYKV